MKAGTQLMMGDMLMSASRIAQCGGIQEGLDETVVQLADGWSLRSGLYDGSSSGLTSGEYVRLCDPTGDEQMYWDAEEWGRDPELVMGAILNAAAGLRVHIIQH